MRRQPLRSVGRLADGDGDAAITVPDPAFARALGAELDKIVVPDEPTLFDLLDSLSQAFDSIPKWSPPELKRLVEDSYHEWNVWFENCADERARELKASYHPALAVAIYLYTLQDPDIYRLVNKELNDTGKRCVDGKLSDELLIWIPYIQFLMVALKALPVRYVWTGAAFRGVKWVYMPDDHNLLKHYYPGKTVPFYSFKSFARSEDVPLGSEMFMGTTGLRTLFEVEAPCMAYDISVFSDYGEDEQEVVFHPLTLLQVVLVEQRLEVDAARHSDKASASHLGLHDRVVLKQKKLTRDDACGVWLHGHCKSGTCTQRISCEAEGEEIDLLDSSIECPSCHQSWGVDSIQLAGCTWRSVVMRTCPNGGLQTLTGQWEHASEVSSESFGDARRVTLEIRRNADDRAV